MTLSEVQSIEMEKKNEAQKKHGVVRIRNNKKIPKSNAKKPPWRIKAFILESLR